MINEQILTALGNLEGPALEKAAACRMKARQRTALRRWVAAAACLVLVLSLAVTTEAASGTVSNLLAPLFHGAQTQIVDRIGKPLHAEASAGGYTIRADAILGDRYQFYIVYTLIREDGQPLPENLRLGDWDWNQENFGTGGSLLTSPKRDAQQPDTAHFWMHCTRKAPVLGRLFTIRFTQLTIFEENQPDELLAQGPWELTFTLRYPDTSEKLPVFDLRVTDLSGNAYRVKSLILSPVGLHMDLIRFDPNFPDDVLPLQAFPVSLILTDQREILLEDRNIATSCKEGAKKGKAYYTATFPYPIPREDIAAICICGTRFPVPAP